ncbi:MAG: aldose epimerase family protein [Aulosira sp. ZfuVER01]|nr:aldose epimerase family protein [Aulosira sp. ZfuVER01]MDZ7996997.1 aldose epimerase family protein [Aulosira sp. DedVER01a]MDZ8053026.1 aldose epimerase family protein [Aulosira sp. ZfuCHP01]
MSTSENISSPNPSGNGNQELSLVKESFGEVDNQKVYLFTFTNKKSDRLKITNYGGIVTAWISTDKNGNKSSIVIGYNNLDNYLAEPPYFGALIGRFANRIAKGKFQLQGQTYSLPTNNGENHLHGGNKGFDKVVWDAEIINGDPPTLLLSYLSQDGEEGYPGNLQVTVRYKFTDDNELEIEYNAETDKATPINLTNHSYFNLTSDVSNSILNHTLMIEADNYTPVDSNLIPTGEIKSVIGTPFDFKTPEKIGTRIKEAGGYDHNYVLNQKDNYDRPIVILTDDISGRKLEVFTDQPGMQFYSGNMLNGAFKTDEGKAIEQHAALCLETQHFPNSPNEPRFPSAIINPGEKYHTITKYKLSLQ